MSIADHIETIESAYEYLLAYAAQGKQTDVTADGRPSEARQTIQGLYDALSGLQSLLRDADYSFAQVICDDAHRASAALELVLTQVDISSELVDNLNASIHLRAVLTDLFLLDEVTVDDG